MTKSELIEKFLTLIINTAEQGGRCFFDSRLEKFFLANCANPNGAAQLWNSLLEHSKSCIDPVVLYELDFTNCEPEKEIENDS